MFPFPDCLGVEGTTHHFKARRQRRKRMMLRSWRDALERQLAAVTLPDESALILAGAGSGKTRVLTTRIAWLIQQRRVSPAGVLAVTFTNKAAKEMLARLSALLIWLCGPRGPWRPIIADARLHLGDLGHGEQELLRPAQPCRVALVGAQRLELLLGDRAALPQLDHQLQPKSSRLAAVPAEAAPT